MMQPRTIYMRFSEGGLQIRKWSFTPFDGGVEYRPTPPKPAEDRAREMLAAELERAGMSLGALDVRRNDDKFLSSTELCALRAITAALTTSPAVAEAVENKADRDRAILRNIVSHATGGHIDLLERESMSLNDICVEISRHHNRVWKGAQESALSSLKGDR